MPPPPLKQPELSSESLRSLTIAHDSTSSPNSAVTTETTSQEQVMKSSIDNFPLPRELRDNIYRFLLHPDEISYIPDKANPKQSPLTDYFKYGSTAHSYKYHTNILAVNSTIGKEAEEYLYKNSTFIEVRHDCTGLPMMVQQMDVPMVSDLDTGKFDNHSLSIIVESTKSPWMVVFSDNQQSTHLAGQKGSFLMLARDLHRLRDVLRLLCAHIVPQVPYTVGGHAPMLDHAVSTALPLPLKIRVNQTTHKALSQDEQREVLEMLKTINGGGYRMGLANFHDEQLVREVIKATSPMVIWLAAQEWDRLDIYLNCKERADQLALAGNFDAARDRYEFLIQWMKCEAWPRFYELPVTGKEESLSTARLGRCLLIFDVALSRAWIDHRRGNRAAVREAIGIIDRNVPHQNMPKKMSTRYIHLLSFYELNQFSLKGVQYRQRDKVSTDLQCIGLSLATATDHQVDDHAEHDLMYLKGAMETYIAEGYWNASPDGMSLSALPVRTFDTASEQGLPSKSDGLVGWQDTKALSSLTDREKKEVMALHGKQGCRLATVFAARGVSTF